MKRGIAAVIFLLGGMLAGCGGEPREEARLDTSSNEAMEASIRAMTVQMSPDKRQQFQKALSKIYVQAMIDNIGGDRPEAAVITSVNAELDGKTAVEIFQRAEGIDPEAWAPAEEPR